MDTNVIANISTENNVVKPTTRFNWLDWMKVIGISLIVYGHFFSVFDRYVYVFSVPVFFLISGFLCKHESDNTIFWKKLFYNLAIPLFLICTINYLIGAIQGYFFSENSVLPENPFTFYGKMLIGHFGAVGGFWFVYTLMILKIILQFTNKAIFHLLWGILFLFFAYFINNNDIQFHGENPFSTPWAITNTFVSYPFFMIGHYLSKLKSNISNYNVNKYTFCWIFLSLIVVFLCGHNHEYVFIFMCGYGDNLFLFLIGGLAGSVLVFFISKLLDKFRWKFITEISIGTLIILGFHIHLIKICKHFIHHRSITDALLSVLIVLAFVPIIRLCEQYFPIILGKYRIKKS